jgi:hypothetical protein
MNKLFLILFLPAFLKSDSLKLSEIGRGTDYRSYQAEFSDLNPLCPANCFSSTGPLSGVTPLSTWNNLGSRRSHSSRDRNSYHRNLTFERMEERAYLSGQPVPLSSPPLADAGNALPSIESGGATQSDIAASAAAPMSLPAVATPQSPKTFDVPYALPTGGVTYRPATATELQAAFNAANPGDVIVLTAGVTYKGTFILPPAKPNPQNKYVYVISSEMSALKEGQRINPATDAAHMPKLTFPDAYNGNQWVLATNGNSSYWRFNGIEFYHSGVGDYAKTGVLVTLGWKDANPDHHYQGYWSTPTSAADLPDHIVFDRVYIHSNLPVNSSDAEHYCEVGIEMSGTNLATVNSHISNMRMGGEEAYAIHLYQGVGPYKIVNNYLEASGINFFSGGGDPTITGSIPSDIEFRGNSVYKNPSWNKAHGFYAVKNLLELKNAVRVLIDGNIFDGSPGTTGDYGNGITITPRNQGGKAPWSTVGDVTFTNNIVKNVAVGMKIASNDGNFSNPALSGYSPASRLQRLKVSNNAFVNVDYSLSEWASGFSFSFSNLAGSDWSIEHNLVLPGPNADAAQFNNAARVNGLRVLPWAAGTAYSYYSNGAPAISFGDIVTRNGHVYMAKAAHTSSANFDADFAADMWVQMPDGSNFVAKNFIFNNNLLAMGHGGFGSTAGAAYITLTEYFDNWSFANNGFIARPVDASYGYKDNPNYWAADFNHSPMVSSYWIDGMAATGFANYANGNYGLTAQSAYHNVGTDGKDLGPDWTVLNNATKNTLTGGATVGVQITESGDSTNVIEAQTTDTYALVLTAQPAANVTITLTPSSQVSVDKTVLTFTASNWNVAQTVTISALDDHLSTGPRIGTISHQVASSDPNFNGIAVASVTVNITDIGVPPAVPSALGANSVSTTLINLSWVDNANNEDGFEIERKTGASGSWSEIASVGANATSYAVNNCTPGTTYYYRVCAYNAAGDSSYSNEASATTAATTATVVGRKVFYANSAYDKSAAGYNADNAIPSDKQALFPGQTASFVNYTNYYGGINGIVIDIARLANPAQFSLADLQFRMGNDNNPAAWLNAPAPLSVTVRQGMGQSGSDRVTVLWSDRAIKNTWLQVTVKATAATGLPQTDVFYFGNAVGETGNNPINAVVDKQDEKLIAANRTGVMPASIVNPYDVNRDRMVNATDMYITRCFDSCSNPLRLISPGVVAGSAAAVADASPSLEILPSPVKTSPANSSASPLESSVSAASSGSADRQTALKRHGRMSRPVLRANEENGKAWKAMSRQEDISRSKSAHDSVMRDIAAETWSFFPKRISR